MESVAQCKKRGDIIAPLSPKSMRQDEEYQNKIVPHFCGTIFIWNPQYSRLSGPPTLLKNEDAIGPGAKQSRSLGANT
jgi:hypothetical protein